MKRPLCMRPGCTKPSLCLLEVNDSWVCEDHLAEHLDRPDIRAANQANADFEEFLENGGKPS